MKGRKSAMPSGSKMRNLGGVKAPAYGESKAVIKEAEGKTTGIVGMDGIGVDGVPAKARLDRPARKYGGRKC